jgi:type IV pilus assembly protein PilO
MNLMDQLRNIDPNDPGRWPLPIRLAAIGLVLVIASIGFTYYFAWSPQQPILAQAVSEEAKLLTLLEMKARKAANLEAYKAQLKEMEQSFGAMLRQLPNKTEVPSLLVDISQKGLEAGLDQKLFQPGAPVQHDFYSELPIKIKLTGSFHSIGNFVSGVAALPRIVTLHDIIITSASKGANDNLQLEVTAKTYRYVDDEQGATAAAKAPNPGNKANPGSKAKK